MSEVRINGSSNEDQEENLIQMGTSKKRVRDEKLQMQQPKVTEYFTRRSKRVAPPAKRLKPDVCDARKNTTTTAKVKAQKQVPMKRAAGATKEELKLRTQDSFFDVSQLRFVWQCRNFNEDASFGGKATPPSKPSSPVNVRTSVDLREADLRRKVRQPPSPAVTIVHKSLADEAAALTFSNGSAKRQLKFVKTPLRDKAERRNLESAGSTEPRETTSSVLVVPTLQVPINRKLLFRDDSPESPSASTFKADLKNLSRNQAKALRAELLKSGNLKNLRNRLSKFDNEVSAIGNVAPANAEVPPTHACQKSAECASAEQNAAEVSPRARAELQLTSLFSERNVAPFDALIRRYLDDIYSMHNVLNSHELTLPLPAHVRLRHLGLPPSLRLPASYDLLHEKFRCADGLVAMMHNRTELVTAARLMSSVQGALRKDFTLKNIGQIRTVYPEAYVFEQKIVPKYGERRQTSNNYQLIITPNLETDLLLYAEPPGTPVKCGVPAAQPPQTPVKTPQKGDLSKATPTKAYPTFSPRKDGARMMAPGQLAMRQEVFRWRLMGMVKEKHETFLQSLSPPVLLDATQRSRLVRWHPKFRLDKVDPIPPADLPEAPFQPVLTSARETLERLTKDSVPESITLAVERQVLKQASPQLPSSDCPIGVNLSLRERIRLKEAASAKREMFTSSEDAARRKRLSQLPSVARTIHSLFMMSNDKPMDKQALLSKIGRNHALQQTETSVLLTLLTEVVPSWLQMNTLPTTGAVYVKISKLKSLKEVIEAIERAA